MPSCLHAKTLLRAERFFLRACYYFSHLCFPCPQAAYSEVPGISMSLGSTGDRFLSSRFETGLFLSSAFSLFSSSTPVGACASPYLHVACMEYQSVTDLFLCHCAEFGNSQEIQSPKNRFFPSLESLSALLLQDPSSKMCSLPRSSRVQEATLPFKLAGDGSHH